MHGPAQLFHTPRLPERRRALGGPARVTQAARPSHLGMTLSARRRGLGICRCPRHFLGRDRRGEVQSGFRHRIAASGAEFGRA